MRELLDVKLVANSHSRRDDAHVFEGLLRPLEEVVAFGIALVLEAHVLLKATRATRDVGDNGMVDNQIARDLRVYLFRIPSQGSARLAHHREIDENGNTREILKQHTRRRELDLFAGLPRQARGDDAIGERAGDLG